VSLPWLGLLLTLALLGQEVLLRWFGTEPSLPLSLYQVIVMAIGVASLTIILLPLRQVGYLLGFLVCAGLMAWAFWLQYHDGLEPCPLCMFQRVAVAAAGVVFLVAFLHNPRRRGATFYAFLIAIFAGAGAALAGRQIWLQSLRKDQVPACGMGLNYMIETLPFADVILKVLAGSGECAEKGWEFWASIPAGRWCFRRDGRRRGSAGAARLSSRH
jgi:disulfide bond formation protein DsbB